jgi:hypothetical protein
MLRTLALCAALTACVDDPDPEVGQLEQDVEIYCPGMTTSGIQTYRGLSGTYRRVNLPVAGEPLKLTLAAETDDTEAHGAFTGLVATDTGLGVPYGGRFGALADNPAIGAAFLLDLNSDGEYDKLYFVLGSSRLLGRVQSLCLVGGDHPFQLSRSIY